MVVIYDKETLQAFRDKIDSCKSMYENAFPVVDEREDFDLILHRIETKTFQEDAKTFLVLDDNAGMVVEFYPSSESLLITYIFVDETHRQKGIGEELLLKGLQNVKSKITDNLKKPCFAKVFLEVHSPEKSNEDSSTAARRYEFFKKNGAKKIDIPYVQPSLGQGKERVRDLDLLTIPFNGERLQNRQLFGFLYSFYKELGIDDPNNDADFRQMNISNTDAEVTLNELEYYAYASQHQFHHCSIAMHLPILLQIEPSNSCCTFSSFEQDLKSYWFQKNKRISSHVANFSKEIEMQFPESLTYYSEGRKEKILFKKEEDTLSCHISASITNFIGKYSVVTFIIQPNPNAFFTEFDIIKLCAVFGSKQEQTLLIDNISIGVLTFKEFIAKTINGLFKNNNSATTNISQFELSDSFENISGTVVLNIEDGDTFNSQFDLFQKLDLKRNDTVINAEQLFGSSSNRDNRLLCAFLLGIFDFNRLNKEEIIDTLVPVNTGIDCLMLVNRGCLLVLRRNDDIYFNVKKSIGINPYYILPFIVVAFNEFMMFNAEKLLKNIEKLKREQQEMNVLKARKLLLDMVEGVFEYPSENRLLAYVENERHTQLMLSDINLQINFAKEELDFQRKRVLLFFEGLIGYILLLFGIVQGSIAVFNLLTDFGVVICHLCRIIIILTLIGASSCFYFRKTRLTKSLLPKSK